MSRIPKHFNDNHDEDSFDFDEIVDEMAVEDVLSDEFVEIPTESLSGYLERVSKKKKK